MPPKHLICLTIDTDPDGLNTHTPDRRTLDWTGLEFAMQQFHDALPHVPLTWYVRADGQLEMAYGSVRYLLDEYADFWRDALARSDELGWHPHLYNQQAEIILDETLAVAELQQIHRKLAGIEFALPTFRMGEAWHTPATLNLIEALGYTVDSTAIPGRDDSASGHPRNWANTPNEPYYPAYKNVQTAIASRPLLEVPMNSWYFQASYDQQPKLRYMNPCIHAELWQQALDWWAANLTQRELYLWNLILHPAEAMPHDKPDLLYAYSTGVMAANLQAFEQRITAMGHTIEYTTIHRAAQQWINQ